MLSDAQTALLAAATVSAPGQYSDDAVLETAQRYLDWLTKEAK